MSNNYNSTLQSNNTDLQAILNTINGLPEAVKQATPTISVNGANGLITATAGTKSSTHQLAFQAAKTITPNTTSQIAVSSGYYTGGNITVAGDSNLVAGNIKSGVSIFGVAGNYEGSGGGDTSVEDGLVTRTVTVYENSRVTTVGYFAFNSCATLTSVNFPKVTGIYESAFGYCRQLASVSFPVATLIGYHAFQGCPKLTSVYFPKVTNVSNYAFYNCSNLTSVSLPVATSIYGHAFGSCPQLTSVSLSAATSIYDSAFYKCYNLKALYLTGSSVCTLSNSNAFSSTPIGGYSTSAGTYGSIYVPASLLASYKAATNWVFFSNRIFASPGGMAGGSAD